MATAIEQAVFREMQRQSAIIETACERALVGGTCGVLVVRDGTSLVSAEPDDRVPYGFIWDAPAEALGRGDLA